MTKMFTFVRKHKVCILGFLIVLIPNLTASEYGFMLKQESPIILMGTEGVNFCTFKYTCQLR